MTNVFEDLLDMLEDDTEKQALRNIGAKYANKTEFKERYEGRLRQQDYSKQMNALKGERDIFQIERDKFQAREKELENDIKMLQSWREWRKAEWDEGANMTRTEKEKLQALEEAQAELETLRKAQEAGNVTFQEVEQYIDKELGKRAVITKDYIEKEWKPKVIDKEFYEKDVQTRVGAMANGMEYIYDETFPLVLQHKEEFGEVIKPSAILKYANENGIREIGKAYEAMVSNRRTEVLNKKNEEALKKAKEEGRQEALKERAMGPNGQLPVDSGPPVMGHVQKRMTTPADQRNEEIPEGASPGQMAAMVAARYRKDTSEGKALQVA